MHHSPSRPLRACVKPSRLVTFSSEARPIPLDPSNSAPIYERRFRRLLPCPHPTRPQYSQHGEITFESSGSVICNILSIWFTSRSLRVSAILVTRTKIKTTPAMGQLPPTAMARQQKDPLRLGLEATAAVPSTCSIRNHSSSKSMLSRYQCISTTCTQGSLNIGAGA